MTISLSSFAQELRIRWQRWSVVLSPLLRIVMIVLLLRVGFGLVAIVGGARLSVPPPDGHAESLGERLQRLIVMPWMEYDANFYRTIVTQGYSIDDNSTSFHPLYPLLTALVAPLVGGNVQLALLLVSTCACIVLCSLLERYVIRFYNGEYAQSTILLLMIAAPGFILLAPYTESLFLLLAVASLYAMRVERWWLAGILGGLASLTRQQGLALAVPLAWGVWIALRQQRASILHAGAVLLVPLGYALFVLYRAVALGDLHSLSEAGDPVEMFRRLMVSYVPGKTIAGQHIGWPGELLYAQVRLIYNQTYNLHLVIDLILGWVWVVVILLGLKQMNTLERWYSITIVGLALCYYNGDIDPYMSLPRHIILAFPMYIVLAYQIKQHKLLRLTMLPLLTLLNLFVVFLYFNHAWIP